MMTTETPGKKTRCQHISKIGARCHADPQTGKRFCFFHDPEQKKKQALARQQGGEARSRQLEIKPSETLDLPDLRLQSGPDVLELLSEIIKHFCAREIGFYSLKTMAYLASLQLRALKQKAPEVIELLARTINQLRRNEIRLHEAKALGQVASLMLCALKQEAREVKEAEEQQLAAENDGPGKKLRDDLKAMLTSVLPVKPAEEKKPNEVYVEQAREPAFA